ncbi:MAG: hypothetical protein AB7I27_10465 [Bacteriovoracaceae bacterium]
MLRLFFYTQDRILKVRPARMDEAFTHPTEWRTLQFEVTTNKNYTMAWTSLLPDLDPKDANSLLDLVGARYPVSPKYETLRQLCSEIVFNKEADEWVFFGGSFNPWHKGHQACLKLLGQEKYCFVIPDRNPFKELRELEPVSTILELSSKIRFGERQFLVPTFLLDHKKNPTIEWVSMLKQKYPDKRISLLMGYDGLSQITSWTRASELLPMLDTLYVAARLENDEMREKALQKITPLAPALKIEFLGRHEFENLSSTEIRQKKRET